MSKNITIDDEGYNALLSLKTNQRESFTEVIRRYVIGAVRCDTAGELLDAYERMPPPRMNLEVLKKIRAGRGRRSGGRR